MSEGFVEIAKITKTYGTAGFFRIIFFTDCLNRFNVGKGIKVRTANGELNEYVIEAVKEKTSKWAILKLKDVCSLTMAEKFTGNSVVIPESARVHLADDEYYPDELVDFSVVYNKKLVGKIIEIYDFAVYSLLEIENEKNTFLIPFIKRFVDLVDKKAGSICLTKDGYEVSLQ